MPDPSAGAPTPRQAGFSCSTRSGPLQQGSAVHTGMVCVQVRELPPYEAKPKKPASEIVTYANEFLLKFSEVSTHLVYKANS